jgi:hypothetical protein
MFIILNNTTEKEMKIRKDKKYKLRMGGDIKIYEILYGYVFGAYRVEGSIEWNSAKWKDDGTYLISNKESCLDLIEVSPYADFEIDDKVLVWDDGEEKQKAHFAGIGSSGNPKVWIEGKTSFTGSTAQYFSYCIKYEENNDNE